MSVGSGRRGAASAGLATTWLWAVLLPWASSRYALYLLIQSAGALRGRFGFAAYGVWDGPWYTKIARDGYGFTTPAGETPYPFFPLLPGLLHAGDVIGATPLATGVVLNHLVFLLALTGVYMIARDHFSPLEAGLASWSLALYPGSAPLTLVYPCVIFLACAVWSFRAIEHQRDWTAALLAAAAALVRPNGFVLALALGFATWRASDGLRRAARIMLPAAACVAAWMGWLLWQTGDPLIFLHAKDAWHEVNLASLLSGRDRLPKLDLAPLAGAALVLALTWRRLPGGWLLFVALALLPSLALGILGMPRYVACCFPLFVGAGILLARVPASIRVVILAISGALLLLVARRTFLLEQMP